MSDYSSYTLGLERCKGCINYGHISCVYCCLPKCEKVVHNCHQCYEFTSCFYYSEKELRRKITDKFKEILIDLVPSRIIKERAFRYAVDRLRLMSGELDSQGVNDHIYYAVVDTLDEGFKLLEARLKSE